MNQSNSKLGTTWTIVWGASGGVGQATVKAILKNGGRVVAYTRNPAEIKDLSMHDDRLIVRNFNIREDFYNNEVAYLSSQGFILNGMVDCVGSASIKPDASRVKRMEDILTPNLYHPYYASLAFGEVLEPGAGIVLISSIRALTGTNNQNIEYAFAKAAVENLTKSLKYMFSKRKIRVNCIRPTPISGTKISRGWPKHLKDCLKSYSVYGELLTPDDIADIAVYLLSDQSRGITGSIIDVDKGFSSIS